MGAGPPLSLDWGSLETAGAEQQAMSKILRSSSSAPVIQRLNSRGAAPWLVQFNGVIREEGKTAVENAGALIKGYIPENALLVAASPKAIVRIGALPGVAWVGEYLPAYKKAKAVREWRPDDAAKNREFNLFLFDSADKARVTRELGEMPGASVSRAEVVADRALIRVWLLAKQVEDVANWGEVEWIEPYIKPQLWGASGDAASESTPSLQQVFDDGARVYLDARGIADAGSYGVDSFAIDRFTWDHPEMLAVVAAGNAATDTKPADGVVDAGSAGSPATAKNALSVGASEGRRDGVARTWRDSWPEDFAVEPIALDRMAQADGPQGLAAFSGRGPCADGRIKPDLVAPGTFLPVSRSDDSAATGWGVADNTNEIYAGGTGVAAEQAAAAAAQARQWLIEARGIASPSAALVKALLINGAQNLAPGQYGAGPKQEIPDARPNSAQGFGLLDVAGALQPGEGEMLDLRDAKGLATSASDAFELNIGQAGGRFVLTLAYSDYAAAFGAGKKQVNDLDLTLQTPSGEILHSNGRTELDPLNNVEMIELAADEAGTYVARVEARNVPMGGSQPYALVIRGPRMEAAAAAALE